MNAPDRAAWLAGRKAGLGGSDIAAILGLSPWRSAVDVYLDKRGESADQSDNDAMYWGRVLEDVVATEFAQRTGKRVQRVNAQLRHPDHDWMIGNIDRAIVAEGSRARLDSAGRLQGAAGILECKTANAYAAKDWDGPDGSDSVPVYYAAQVMHYMAITGQDTCDVAALIGGQRYVHRVIERDEETIRGMIEQAREFWFAHVVAGVPPDPRSAADALRLFQRDHGQMIEIGDDTGALVALNEYRALRAQLKDVETRTDDAADRLKLLIGPASGLSMDGRPVVTWKAAKDSLITDYASAAKALLTPDQLAPYQITKPGSRRFITKD